MPAQLERRKVRLTVNTTGKAPRREMLEGRSHLVVEGAILPAEGVVHGSGEPLLYPKEENQKSVSDWNHQPIVLYHPKDGEDFISARQPDVINTRKMGVVLNTGLDDKVRTEFWFDEERTKQIDNRVYEKVNNGEPVEVSTGLDLEVEAISGELNGVKYTGIARNYKPDHVAVLPDRIGAFSVKMGGGLYANELKEQPESRAVSLDRAVQEALTRIQVKSVNNELSFSDITCELNDLLSAKYGEPGKYWSGYVCEVYGDYVIFRKGGSDSWKYQYMIGYTVKDDEVALTGQEKQVEQVVTYQVANGATYEAKEGRLSPKEVPVSQTATFDKKAHVTALIANGQIKEADRAKYEGLAEDVLQGIQVVQKEAPKVDPPKVEPVANEKGNEKKLVVNLDNLDPSIRRQVERGLAAEKRQKDALVKVITGNAANPFSEAFLQGKELDELEGLAAFARANGQQADDTNGGMFNPGYTPGYVGAAGVHPSYAANQAPLDEPLVIPEDEVASKK